MRRAELCQLVGARNDVEQIVQEGGPECALDFPGWCDQFQIASPRPNRGQKRRKPANSGAVDMVNAAQVERKGWTSALQHF